MAAGVRVTPLLCEGRFSGKSSKRGREARRGNPKQFGLAGLFDAWQPRKGNAMQTQPSEYLSTADAAVYLKVSRKFLETARCQGDGPPFIKIGRAVRYRRGDLDEFMRAHQRTETDKTRVLKVSAACSYQTKSTNPKRAFGAQLCRGIGGTNGNS